MVSNSTYILNQKTNHGNKIRELSDLLKDLLEDDTHKIVIFSQWKCMFDLVIDLLNKHKVKYVYLNGDIPAKQRNYIMEEFTNNPEIKVFLSTDAGGVGVNLQRGNILINLDLPWNPAVLEQRIARIYRLGQQKHISVFNFISQHSIEHRILYLLDFKKSVFTGVIEEEGKDEVMLEGFMESVRALTEVNMEERYHKNVDLNNNSITIIHKPLALFPVVQVIAWQFHKKKFGVCVLSNSEIRARKTVFPSRPTLKRKLKIHV
ncbi:MAG: hypothetical protein GVY19_11225 [Bacteroidetes bacterium]|jgi:superfamily II DNA/RNA helicase|nr:hypothetical protein [Bacteroidota bacterium]